MTCMYGVIHAYNSAYAVNDKDSNYYNNAGNLGRCLLYRDYLQIESDRIYRKVLHWY
jgi:hypothetical protein